MRSQPSNVRLVCIQETIVNLYRRFRYVVAPKCPLSWYHLVLACSIPATQKPMLLTVHILMKYRYAVYLTKAFHILSFIYQSGHGLVKWNFSKHICRIKKKIYIYYLKKYFSIFFFKLKLIKIR